jgi:hypothetical protein
VFDCWHAARVEQSGYGTEPTGAARELTSVPVDDWDAVEDPLALFGVEDAGNGAVLLDLSGLRWLLPIHLVAAASLAHAHAGTGRAVRLVGPEDAETAHYAGRMRLGKLLDAVGAEHDVPSVRERDLRTELLEVTMLQGPDDVRRLAELVHDKVRATDAAAAAALFDCLAELGSNVYDHAGTVGFAAAQTLPRTGYVRFAVGDAGVGLLETLRRHEARTDRDAIALALSGASRLPDRDRGRGLPSTLELVSVFGGSLHVVTGHASVNATSIGRTHRDVAVAYGGTLLEGTVRTAR